MLRFFLTRILSWLASMSWSDFLRIVDTARTAAAEWPKPEGVNPGQKTSINGKRVAVVNGFIEQTFPMLKGATMNVIRELAVAWLNRSAAK